VELEHPEVGKFMVPGVPIRFSDTPAMIKSFAPALGEHNFEVYGELLDISREEVEALHNDGVI